MWKLAVAVLVLAACDDPRGRPPPTLTAGPVTLDTDTLTLAVSGAPALVQDHFLSIGTTGSIDPSHYYDPRGDDLVDMTAVETATELDGDWLVLAGGTRLKLSECEVEHCAILEIDASKHAKAVQLRVSLPVDPAEPLYGTGDAADRANVNGAVREMSLRVDLSSASSLNETHVPVPLVIWPRRDAAMFVADDRPGALDLGASTPGTVMATFDLPVRGTYRIYLYTTGHQGIASDLVRGYVALTTKPAVPPRWAFTPQLWRNAWQSGAEMRGDANELRTRKIPGSVMWIDNPWQTAYNTHIVDETRFPQPQQLLSDLAAQGYKVIFWSTPYVGKTAANAVDRAEGVANNFFVTDDGGITVDWPWQEGPGAMVDFTRDGAIPWWRERLRRVIDVGAAGFKLDFGEELVPDISGNSVQFLLAGGDNFSHHNRYSAGYHEAYLGALPPGDGFLITRTGAWGEQNTNTAIWPGDLESDFSEHGTIVGGKINVGGLPSAISRGLSLSVSGYPFYGSDIGGFRGFPTTEALLRWAEYAALGTIMQLGGGGKSHDPWDASMFTAGADVIYKTYADLHMLLNPFLWTLAIQAGTDGTPVTAPAKFLYECACDDAMFLLGNTILVAPVVTAGATTRTVVLPPGAWVSRATGETNVGDGHTPITVPAPLDTLPMWYRAYALIPMFARLADTLLPATAAGVTSYADPAYGRELRVVYAASTERQPIDSIATTTLHDGTRVTGHGTDLTVTGGIQYDVITLDVDGRSHTDAFGAPTAVSVDTVDLPLVADDAALFACAAPGCYRFDAASKHLQARVYAPQGQMKSLGVR